MRLTQHFSLHEFTRSQTAQRMGRSIIAPPDVVANLARLCELLLQPLRTQLGRPITITSGYRPDWLNAAIRGAPQSDHLTGSAADFVVAGMTAHQASAAAARLLVDAPFQQIIHEFGSWTHISLAPHGRVARRQVVTAYHDGIQVRYAPGVVKVILHDSEGAA